MLRAIRGVVLARERKRVEARGERFGGGAAACDRFRRAGEIREGDIAEVGADQDVA